MRTFAIMRRLQPGRTINYRCEDRKKVGEIRVTSMTLDRSRLPLSETQTIRKKPTVQPGHSFDDTAFKPVFQIVKF